MHPAVNCIHADTPPAGAVDSAVACALGLYGGTPSIGCCRRCPQRAARNARDPRATLPSSFRLRREHDIATQGPLAWAELHRLAATDSLTPETLVTILAPVRRGGCACNGGVDAWLAARPLPTVHQAAWVGDWHDWVNKKLGKPEFRRA